MSFAFPSQRTLVAFIEAETEEHKTAMYERLKEETGQDFGDDVGRWREWVTRHPLGKRESEITASSKRWVDELLRRQQVAKRIKGSPLTGQECADIFSAFMDEDDGERLDRRDRETIANAPERTPESFAVRTARRGLEQRQLERKERARRMRRISSPLPWWRRLWQLLFSVKTPRDE